MYRPTAAGRRHYSITLKQASEEAPVLAPLLARLYEANQRFKAIELLIPVLLRPSVKAGPVEGTNWCLVVKNNAVAAKMRQLVPLLQTRLNAQGWEVTTIRVVIQSQSEGRV